MDDGCWGVPSWASVLILENYSSILSCPKAVSGPVTTTSAPGLGQIFSCQDTPYSHLSLKSFFFSVSGLKDLSFYVSLYFSYCTIPTNPLLRAEAFNLIRWKDLEIISVFHSTQPWVQWPEGEWVVSWQELQVSLYRGTWVQRASKWWTWILIQPCILKLAPSWSVNEYNFHSNCLLPGSSLDTRKLRTNPENPHNSINRQH